MSPAPWIWPMMTSGTMVGTYDTVTDAVSVRPSLRSEFGVQTRWPVSSG
jgi:hypothetical protein